MFPGKHLALTVNSYEPLLGHVANCFPGNIRRESSVFANLLNHVSIMIWDTIV